MPVSSTAKVVDRAYPLSMNPGGKPVSRNAMARNFLLTFILCAFVLLSACATPDAPDLRGRWRAVNQFAEAPTAIPLHQSYVYEATPSDGTLKTMLNRWARDSKRNLSYLHPNDYTLHLPVSRIRTTSLEQAAAELSTAYAAEGVYIVINGTQIVVSSAPSADAPVGRSE